MQIFYLIFMNTSPRGGRFAPHWFIPIIIKRDSSSFSGTKFDILNHDISFSVEHLNLHIILQKNINI